MRDKVFSGSQHRIVKCSCGKVLLQCRCPSPDKKVEVVQNGCAECGNAKES